ncbi:hypothetical protein Ciccas_003080 [Cichlidogyrus casuarinus]|uniref:Glucose-methanol-choline oxidoreductase N-terminal domain-containing protein n=1 Tax=Cichlidogyrus casuarinus TaxID=1844966 RepID=A0ABD2QFL5_9PLAT
MSREYSTTRQHHGATGMKDKRVLAYAGNAVGGTAMLNAMIMHFGSSQLGSSWDLEGWTFEEIKRLIEEDMQEGKSGTDCAIIWNTILIKPDILPLHRIFANISHLFPQTNYSGWAMEGVFTPLVSVHDGQRVSSYNSCLEPLVSNGALDLAFETKINRLIFQKNGTSLKVSALELSHRGVTRILHLKSTAKVVLSAGSIESPAILLRSGVGPRSVLDIASLPQVKELPVGVGFQDMPMIGVVGWTKLYKTMTSLGVIGLWDVLQYFTHKTGAFAHASALSNIILLRTSIQRRKGAQSFPNIECVMMAAGAAEQTIFKDASNMIDAQWEAFSKPHAGSSFIITCFLLNPLSKGRITIEPENLSAQIDPNYFSDPADIAAMVEGVSWLHHIFNQHYRYVPEYADHAFEFNQTALQEVRRLQTEGQVELNLPQFLGCPTLPTAEAALEEWRGFYECMVRTQTFTGYHYWSSLRMTNYSDHLHGVTNPDMRVKGVDNLWVGDASVAPVMPDGHPMGMLLAIAKKLAFILAQFGIN